MSAGHLDILFCEVSIQVFCPLVWHERWLVGISYSFWIQALYYWCCRYVLLCDLLFYSSGVLINRLILFKSNVSIFTLRLVVFMLNITLPTSSSQSCFPMLFWGYLIVSPFTFRSTIHLKWIFFVLLWIKGEVSLSFL